MADPEWTTAVELPEFGELPEPPAGSRWVRGFYCSGCSKDIGEPGDFDARDATEPIDHCDLNGEAAWEWMLAPIPEGSAD